MAQQLGSKRGFLLFLNSNRVSGAPKSSRALTGVLWKLKCANVDVPWLLVFRTIYQNGSTSSWCLSASTPSVPPRVSAPHSGLVQTSQRTIGQATEQMEIHQHAEITDGYLHPFPLSLFFCLPTVFREEDYSFKNPFHLYSLTLHFQFICPLQAVIV